MAIAPADRRGEKVSRQLLRDLQSYILEAGDSVNFSDLLTIFRIHPLTLISALGELEKEQIISFSIRHNALTVKGESPSS